MRVGVVGCGYWGSKHVRVLHGLDEVDRVAVIDPDSATRRALIRSFPSALEMADLNEALPQIDALVIATPPRTHARLALTALRAGKHVLVEKPLATSVADGQAMVDAAAEAGVVLMAGHTFEYNAAVHRLREAVRSGELGNVHYVDSARLNLGLYQQDVNVVWDLAPHDISIANFVLDSRPTSVGAWASAHSHGGLQDVATLRLDYDTIGVTATLRLSWLDPCKVRRTTVVGSRKMAVYNDLNDAERIRVYDRGVALPSELAEPAHEIPMTYRYGDVVSPFVDFKEPLATEDRHFVECALSGATPQSSGLVGLDVVRIVVATQAAIRSGSTVELDWGDRQVATATNGL